MFDPADPARLVFPGFTVGKQDPAVAEELARLGVGGFCLYRGTPKTVAALTQRLRRAARGPLLICADYEEGAWVHVPGSTPLPTSLGLGAAGSEGAAREKGRLTARESRAMGVDWVLAPVVDLLTEPKNPIVNLRAFSADPKKAAKLGRAYLEGLHAGGALGCLKHFPGHGSTTQDSHLELPLVSVGKAVLMSRELSPFVSLLDVADSVMLAHLVVPALDRSKTPLSLSPFGPLFLRRRGFKGLIATDALDMHAIAKHWAERDAALLALRAGADVLLVPKAPKALIAELRVEAGRDASLRVRAAESARRLDAALRRVRGPRPAFSVVGGAAHAKAAEPLFAAAALWLRPRRGPAARKVAYFEPQQGPLSGPDFVSALRAGGAKVRVARDGRARRDEALVAGLFVGPRAYSGRIRLDPKAAQRLARAMRRARGATAVSFGSPFPLAGLPGSALCVYSRAPGAQRAAAAAFLGG